jgi:hypothetical protein
LLIPSIGHGMYILSIKVCCGGRDIEAYKPIFKP